MFIYRVWNHMIELVSMDIGISFHFFVSSWIFINKLKLTIFFFRFSSCGAATFVNCRSQNCCLERKSKNKYDPGADDDRVLDYIPSVEWICKCFASVNQMVNIPYFHFLLQVWCFVNMLAETVAFWKTRDATLFHQLTTSCLLSSQVCH